MIRSDGSGTTAQFTAYMANQTPAVWNAFCAKVGIHLNPCPSTSLYPPFNGAVAQQYSDGVAGYVASSYANGAITYVEYGYAKAARLPGREPAEQVRVLHAAGRGRGLTGRTAGGDVQRRRHAEPHQRLQQPRQARVRDVELQLHDRADHRRRRRSTPTRARHSAAFILYFVCAGQQKAEQLGYAPLPKNLVQNAFDVEQKIPGCTEATRPDRDCHNPTIDGTYAPPPAAVTPPPAQNNQGTGTGTGTGTGSGTGTGNGSGDRDGNVWER